MLCHPALLRSSTYDTHHTRCVYLLSLLLLLCVFAVSLDIYLSLCSMNNRLLRNLFFPAVHSSLPSRFGLLLSTPVVAHPYTDRDGELLTAFDPTVSCTFRFASLVSMLFTFAVGSILVLSTDFLFHCTQHVYALRFVLVVFAPSSPCT